MLSSYIIILQTILIDGDRRLEVFPAGYKSIDCRNNIRSCDETIVCQDSLYLVLFINGQPCSYSPVQMRQKLSVAFDGEPGIDAGGLTKELFQVYFQALFTSGQSSGAFLLSRHSLMSDRAFCIFMIC